METWRLLDTGSLPAAENMALDEVILDAVSRGEAPETVRYLQFFPAAVLVGFHQSIDLEVRRGYCRETGIHVNRRITGGGAILFEETHLGWELIRRRRGVGSVTDTDRLFRRLSEPTVRMLKRFGLEARYRPRNDIEIGGRKISGTGGTGDSRAFLFQGTLLVDLDFERFLKSLRIPIEKLKAKEIDSMKERVTTLAMELGRAPDMERIKAFLAEAFQEVFNVVLEPSGLTPYETEQFRKRLPYFRSPAWIDRVRMTPDKRHTARSTYKAPGGVIRTAVVIDRRNGLIQSVLISGDFFTYPRNLINDLEAYLKNIPADAASVSKAVDVFFSDGHRSVPGVSAEDFSAALSEALSKRSYLEYGFTLEEGNRIFTVNGSLRDMLSCNISALLLPYCAKRAGCSYRFSSDCAVCGGCTVSEGYELGRRHGLDVISITSFEDLMFHLEAMRMRGVEGYIGCCCEPFYIKHRDDFIGAALPGILVDVEHTTCYDLDQAREAYAGRFEGQTELNLGLLAKVLHVFC